MPDSSPTDPVDAIAGALLRLRGRRGPRPPWPPGAGPEGPWHREGPGPGAAHEGWARRGPHAHRRGGAEGPWGGRFGGPARLRLLDALAAASGPLGVGEIAERIGVDQPRASRLVQQSVELGLVRREADPDDARRTRIVLTDQGSAMVRGFRGDRRDAVSAALAGFTDAERIELARLLTKLADGWPLT